MEKVQLPATTSIITFGLIHVLFIYLIAYPAVGYISLLGLIPIVGYKFLPIKPVKIDFTAILMNSISFGLGMILTIWLILQHEFTPVFSASLTGVIASLIPNTVLGINPNFIQKISHAKIVMYAGTFAGMTNLEHFSSITAVLYISILGGLIYTLLQNSFSGLGGKLGSIAFGATIIHLSIQHFFS